MIGLILYLGEILEPFASVPMQCRCCLEIVSQAPRNTIRNNSLRLILLPFSASTVSKMKSIVLLSFVALAVALRFDG